MMNTLYPMKFRPVFREKIWGGQKIKNILGMDFSPLPNCGEAWVLSGVPGSETIVSNGFLEGNNLNELMEVYMDDLVGEKVFEKYSSEFPLLIKFIDSNDYLSIQVHPDDVLAAKKNLGNGKTEMWYIMQADENAKLYAGFNKKLGKEEYLDFFGNKKLTAILNEEKPAKDEVYFIPAGTIHSLGPGILLAEIQQSSDTTYRIYDWDRKDDKGKERELHTDEALEALDFSKNKSTKTSFISRLNEPSVMINDLHFNVNNLVFDQSLAREYDMSSFRILLCVEGSAELSSEFEPVEIKKGEAVFIPALIEEISLKPDKLCRILEIYI